MPKRPEEGVLLWSHRQLRHILLLEVPAAFLFLPFTFSTWQGLPVKDTLGIGICVLWFSLKGLPDGLECPVCRVTRWGAIPQPPLYRHLDRMDD
jgi:hypothetical protein